MGHGGHHIAGARRCFQIAVDDLYHIADLHYAVSSWITDRVNCLQTQKHGHALQHFTYGYCAVPVDVAGLRGVKAASVAVLPGVISTGFPAGSEAPGAKPNALPPTGFFFMVKLIMATTPSAMTSVLCTAEHTDSHHAGGEQVALNAFVGCGSCRANGGVHKFKNIGIKRDICAHTGY